MQPLVAALYGNEMLFGGMIAVSMISGHTANLMGNNGRVCFCLLEVVGVEDTSMRLMFVKELLDHFCEHDIYNYRCNREKNESDA